MHNLDYFVNDCPSCKYDFGNENCNTSENYDCTNCKNKDTDSNCYCFKEANKTLKHCPYWRDLDDA